MNLGGRIILIGDSITEWGRHEDPEGIGKGYVRVIHDYFKITKPDSKIEIVNRGVGGNRINDLKSRWDQDILELNPDTVSISIGINDVWRQLDQPELEQIYPDRFEAIYRHLLKQVKNHTNASLILMEPTIIEESLLSEGNKMLKPYVDIVNRLAEEYHAILVPTHQAFMKYLHTNSDYRLTTDGVHLNSAGNLLVAQQWMKAVEN
ncbi:SGNH/GDSL hydrolase family protein [Gracilibacillus dipsosauri]|uniref:Hydrolase n=1 Tax=Gracilibacillus dipsosauri TaxID=178340 RepID=A0A317L1Q5_9BACI|nr:SGNH/GDSL hydrolase family protein [Gracilibacillus dipsosauri]PWU69426.1 hydrolase [Gracilibacillus dipsosauri]